MIFQVRPDVPVPVFTLMVVPVVDLAVSTYTGNRFESIANFTERSTTFFFVPLRAAAGETLYQAFSLLGSRRHIKITYATRFLGNKARHPRVFQCLLALGLDPIELIKK